MTSRRLVGFALCLVFAAAAHGAADATSPTFYEHVLPILQENCQECHRPSGGKIYRGGVPMSLTTYEEARPWARAIVRMTASKEMPPISCVYNDEEAPRPRVPGGTAETAGGE